VHSRIAYASWGIVSCCWYKSRSQTSGLHSVRSARSSVITYLVLTKYIKVAIRFVVVEDRDSALLVMRCLTLTTILSRGIFLLMHLHIYSVC